MKVGFDALIAHANAKIDTIQADDALPLQEAGTHVFVDLRDIRELEREGLIPGAIHCPRGMLEFWAHPESPYHKAVFAQPDKTYLLYCALGLRSALAAATLKDLGMDNVAHIGGGFEAWQASGGPVEEKPSRKG
ncbi:MAG: rhodanese-like domain-containing protein [Pseudomonadota bacterium]